MAEPIIMLACDQSHHIIKQILHAQIIIFSTETSTKEPKYLQNSLPKLNLAICNKWPYSGLGQGKNGRIVIKCH